MADTVELMRKRVLEMAIRGELVDQRLEEGTADILIEEIKNEKKSRKKGINISVIPEVNKPFDLPKNWRWIKFGDLVHFQIGKTPARSNISFWDNGIYPWVSIADIKNGQILNTTKEAVSEEAKNIVFKGGISPRGTLIMSFKLTIGKLAILDTDAFHNEAIISIYPNHHESDTIRDYLFNIINALDLLRDTKAAIKGATLNKASLNEILVPLPPLAEQKRIVSKIEEIFAVIDQIGTKKEEALSIIRNMRQTALQDAIMGVLVDQGENDEPASVLYEKIQAEKEQMVKEKKIKKEKPLPNIEDDEIPFDIPESWKWVRLGDVTNFASHKSVSPSEIEADARLYELEDIESMSGKIIQSKSMDDRISKSNKYVVEAGDILYGKLRPYLNKVACAPEDGYCSTEIFPLKFYGISEGRFLQYFLRSEYFVEYANRNSQGTKMPRLGSILGKHAIMPLPPLAEQERIVEKIEEIMAICDQMETIFDGTSEMNTNLNVV